MVLRKFGKDQSKILPRGGYCTKNFLVGFTILCLSKPHHLLQTPIVHTHVNQKKCAQTTLAISLILRFEPCMAKRVVLTKNKQTVQQKKS